MPEWLRRARRTTTVAPRGACMAFIRSRGVTRDDSLDNPLDARPVVHACYARRKRPLIPRAIKEQNRNRHARRGNSNVQLILDQEIQPSFADHARLVFRGRLAVSMNHFVEQFRDTCVL
jgi:hypothetical protein